MNFECKDMERDFQDRTFNNPDDENGGGVCLREDRLYILKLPTTLTQKDLEKLFSKFGTVTGVFLSQNVDKRYALVTFETVEEARTAMAQLHDTPPLYLSIRFANDKSGQERRQPRRGYANKMNNEHSVVTHPSHGRQREPAPAAPEPIRESVEPARRAHSSVSSGRSRIMSTNDFPAFEDEEEDELLYEEEEEDLTLDGLAELELRKLSLCKARLDYEQAKLAARTRALTSGHRYLTADNKIVVRNPGPARSASRATVVAASELIREPQPLDPASGEFGNVVVKRRQMNGAKESAIDSAYDDLPPLVPLGEPTCVQCGRAGVRRCGGCRVAAYCSEGCQRVDWLRHRKLCANLAGKPNAAALTVNDQVDSAQKESRPMSERNGRTGPPAGYRPPVFQRSDAGPAESAAERRATPRSADRGARPDDRRRPHQERNQDRFNGERKRDFRPNDRSRQDGRAPFRQNPAPAQEEDWGSAEKNTAGAAAAVTAPVAAPKEVEPTVAVKTAATPAETAKVTAPEEHEPKATPADKQDMATLIEEVPKHYAAELTPAGSVVSLSVETSEGGLRGVAVDDSSAQQYALLIEDLGADCDKDGQQITPTAGDFFCLYNEDGWYRARSLDAASAALVDAGRVAPVAGANCRRVPARYVDIPEMCCVIDTGAALKVGESYVCTVVASAAGVVTVRVEADGVQLGEARLSRWRPPVLRSVTETAPAPVEAMLTTRRLSMLKKSAETDKEARPTVAAATSACGEVPAKCSADLLPSAGFMTLMVEAVLGRGRYACLGLTDELMVQYERLLDPLTEACVASAPIQPTAADLFCVLAAEGWYRARLTPAGAAALIDAGRVVDVPGRECRRMPAGFEQIPQFVCELETSAEFKVGESLTCTHCSSGGGAQLVSLLRLPAEGAPADPRAERGELRRWRPYDGVAAPAVAPAAPAAPTAQAAVMEGLTRPPLRAGASVVVVEARSAERVCVRPAGEASARDFDDTLAAVAAYGLTAAPLTTPPAAGALVLARFTDGVFYRALVLKTRLAQNKFKLEYLEFGNEEICMGLERLRACPGALAPPARPVLASLVRLGAAPAAAADERARYLERLKESAAVLVLSLPDGTASAPSGSQAVLTERDSRADVYQTLAGLGKPEWKKMEERGESVLDGPVLTLDDVEYVMLPAAGASLRVWSAGCLAEGLLFGCADDDPALRYVEDKLPAELEEYCASSLCALPYLPRANELCVARVCAGRWCRAVAVEQAAAGGDVTLMCLDHGAVAAASHARVRKMPPGMCARPATGLLVNVAGFPPAPTEEMLARARRVLDAPLAVRACRLDEKGEYTAEAPALIAALAGVD